MWKADPSLFFNGYSLYMRFAVLNRNQHDKQSENDRSRSNGNQA
jgi:hypothetical protein